VAIFAQGKLVWIQAAQEDLDDLDQILFKVLAIAIDEVPEGFEHILLMLLTWAQCSRMELNQLQKVFSEADSDLEKCFGGDKLQIQLRVGWSDQIEVLRSDSCDEHFVIQGRLMVIEDEKQKSHDVIHDCFALEVGLRRLQIAL